jgi:phage tail protein X
MYRYVAHEGERLDAIVYKHYGTLEVFAQVLATNARLSATLKDGDIVYLPNLPKAVKKEAELW